MKRKRLSEAIEDEDDFTCAQTQISFGGEEEEEEEEDEEEELVVEEDILVEIVKWRMTLFLNDSKNEVERSGVWKENETFTIGRKLFVDSTLQAPKEKLMRVSRVHAVIEYSNSNLKQFFILDKSQGGIMVNGAEAVKDRRLEIKSGDTISIIFTREGKKITTELGIRFLTETEIIKVTNLKKKPKDEQQQKIDKKGIQQKEEQKTHKRKQLSNEVSHKKPLRKKIPKKSSISKHKKLNSAKISEKEKILKSSSSSSSSSSEEEEVVEVQAEVEEEEKEDDGEDNETLLEKSFTRENKKRDNDESEKEGKQEKKIKRTSLKKRTVKDERKRKKEEENIEMEI